MAARSGRPRRRRRARGLGGGLGKGKESFRSNGEVAVGWPGLAGVGWGQAAVIYNGGGADLRRYLFRLHVLEGAFPGWALLGGVIFGQA